MIGLRRRVSFGFISIVGVLVLSGMISFIELSTLSNDTEDILRANRRNSELAREMLTAVHSQNYAFVGMTALNDRSLDKDNDESLDRLDAVLKIARRESVTPETIDTMIATAQRMRALSNRFVAAPTLGARYDLLKSEFPQLDSLSLSFTRECYDEYQPIYRKMVYSINEYMTSAEISLAPSAEQLHNNAYRAVTPVFISLVVMIALVLMLFYFILLYCVQPVVKINQALKDYLAYKVPFAPKSQNNDELQELCERISLLIKQSRIKQE